MGWSKQTSDDTYGIYFQFFMEIFYCLLTSIYAVLICNRISTRVICFSRLTLAFDEFMDFHDGNTLVTQPMSQLRPNRLELRSMDLSDQILCRFQKYKRKVPPPSLPFVNNWTTFAWMTEKKDSWKKKFTSINMYF